MKEFLRLQNSLPRAQKVFLVLDQCNAMHDEKGAAINIIESLPHKLSSNVRVLVGIPTGTATLRVPTLNQWQCIELLPISRIDETLMVKRYLKGSRGGIDVALLQRLSQGAGQRGNVRFVRTLLETSHLEGGISWLRNIPMHGLKDLWISILRRHEENLGVWIVRSILLCLVMSNKGMTRKELISCVSYLTSQRYELQPPLQRYRNIEIWNDSKSS